MDVCNEAGAREYVGRGRRELGRGRERTDEFQLWDCFASKSDGPMVQFKLRV